MSCTTAFWKGGLLVGSVLLVAVFVLLSVGVLLAREWRQKNGLSCRATQAE